MSPLGVIGGSGVYQLEGLELKQEIEISTPFGSPSANYFLLDLEGREVIFLPRHGSQHQVAPSFLNYQANIYGMKKLGVDKILSVSACGSLREDIRPLDFVVPDQFIDRTTKRKNTFFEDGIVVHIPLAEPICVNLAKRLAKVLESLDITYHSEGTYLNMEGPQFSTRAESKLYRSWGADVIGMTNFTEARLAREAEICYVSLAAVTDYDCWHPDFGAVDAEAILCCLQKNSKNAKKIVKNFILAQDTEVGCLCQSALEHALVTQPQDIPQQTKENLEIIIGKYLT